MADEKNWTCADCYNRAVLNHDFLSGMCLCKGKRSDHYMHFLSDDHPACKQADIDAWNEARIAAEAGEDERQNAPKSQDKPQVESE